MALVMNVKTPQGVIAGAAYLKIEEQSGNKNCITVRVKTYLSKNDKELGSTSLDEQIITFVPSVTDDAPNFIKQGYEYLKTLDRRAHV